MFCFCALKVQLMLKPFHYPLFLTCYMLFRRSSHFLYEALSADGRVQQSYGLDIVTMLSAPTYL